MRCHLYDAIAMSHLMPGILWAVSWEEEVKQREVVSRNIKESGQFSLISIFN